MQKKSQDDRSKKSSCGFLFNAYGIINFENNKSAQVKFKAVLNKLFTILFLLKFRVVEFDGKSDSENKNDVIAKILKFIQDKWGLDLPDRLISITGSAKDFKEEDEPNIKIIKDRIKELITQSNNTWIISGGTNEGVSLTVIHANS